MPRILFRRFDRGLWVNGPAESAPIGSLRRARGIRGVRSPTLRVRSGATVASAGVVNAHSLCRFMGTRYAGSGLNLYRSTAIVKTAVSSGRLTFVSMPPTVGKEDHLFVAGGQQLAKLNASGTVSNWGIEPPQDSLTLVNFAAGAMAAGTYRYNVTFLNEVTGHRGNPFVTDDVITIGASRQVQLNNIPVSVDPQVTAREIWRTLANGNVLFKRAVIADNTTTTFNDSQPDSFMGSEIMPIDNVTPEAHYDDVAGPWNRRLWWTRDSRVGLRGRLYFSPIARPESVEDFIDVSSDDDPNQKALVWNGFLWVLTTKRLIQVYGDAAGPFAWRQIEGVPGTTAPHAARGTPYGIVYPSASGIVTYDGAKSLRIGFDALEPLWHEGAAENLTTFAPMIAEFHNHEYLASDGIQTLGYDAIHGTWRDLGVGVTAFHSEKDTGQLLAGLSTAVAVFEDEAATTDLGAAIPFEVEPPSGFVDADIAGTVQRLYIEADTQGQLLTPTLLLDREVITLPPFAAIGRETVDYAIGRPGHVFGVRLTGSLTLDCEVFGIEVDLYLPEPNRTTAQVRAAI